MSDDVLSRFHEALVDESVLPNPYDVYRGAAKSWNNAAGNIPGWPGTRMTVPSRKQSFSMAWHEFPRSLAADVDAYLRRAAGLDLDDDHFIRVQRPATIEKRKKQRRLFSTALVRSGVALEDLLDLRAIVTPEIAVRGLQYLLDRNGGASSVQISNLADFLPTLAARLDMPGAAIERLRRMKRKLKVVQNGMTQRNREALRAFDDDTAVAALLKLPRRIAEEVRASGKTGRREAKLIQTALAIELLLNAPVRIQNLASIDLDRHLLEVGSRNNRIVHLRFPAAEVKNSNDLEFPLMPESIELLDNYLSVWRPRLLAGPGISFLFPGKGSDRPKGNGALSEQIKELVYAYTRLDMPAHRFRHAAGKIFLDRNPGHYEVVRQLLGHKDIRTTISFYAGAESASAARHYAQTILGIRHGSNGAEVRHG